MSFEEIKSDLAALPPAEREKASAFLGHLRRVSDLDHRAELDRILSDKNPANWLTLAEFERRLDPQ